MCGFVRVKSYRSLGNSLSIAKWEALYIDKLKSAEGIVEQIGQNSICASTCALGGQVGLSQALAERAEAETLYGIPHHLLLVLKELKYLHPEMTDKVKHAAWFTSGPARKALQNGSADFIPCFYKDAIRLWQ